MEPKWDRPEAERTLAGVKIVFTGSLSHLSRDEVKRIVEERGGRVASSVSRQTGMVVVGDKPGSKVDKARELEVKIITEEDFLKLVRLP